MYIVTIPPSRILTLPEEYKKFLKKGDRFSYEEQGDTIILKKLVTPAKPVLKRSPVRKKSPRAKRTV